MELINVIISVGLYVEIFHCVQAQVTFNPDTVEDVQLQVAMLRPPVEITTVQCYLYQSSSDKAPKITVQYVTADVLEVVYNISLGINGSTSSAVSESSCGQGKNQYRVIMGSLHFISEPTLVGRTFRLKATVDNNEENSTISKRTYTFPAPFNLTGSSVSAVLNSQFTWTCHVSSDYPIIEWLKGSIGQLGIRNETCTSFGMNATYTYNCKPSVLTYTLTIPGYSLNEELQGTNWRCKDVFSEVKGSRFMKLDILVPVTTVGISPKSGPTFDTDENQTITFTCTTNNNANPTPTILWYIGSSNVTSQAGSNRTTLTVNVTRRHNMEYVACVAWNTGNTVKLNDSTAKLYVKFPPERGEELQITGYTRGQVLYENNLAMISIYCTQPGGNPVANMTLTCGSRIGTNRDTATEAIRRLNLTNDRNLNDQQCVCVSTHINGYIRSENVTFIVYYPPSRPTISTSSPFPWKATQSYSLTCNTSKGNPEDTTYTWRDEILNVQYTSQIYNLNPLNSSDNGRQLSCQVSNNFTLLENVVLTSNDTTLHVEYPPTVSLYLHNATENTGDHVIRCSAVGDPNNVTIMVLQQMLGSTFIRNISSFTELSPGNVTLTIPTVSYQDMGAYTCLASNGVPDRSNQKIQSDTAYLNVITSAKFEMMQYTVRSDIDTPAVVKIPFYRNPPATESNVEWTNNTGTSNETLVSSANVSLLLSNADINLKMYNVDVTLRGQSVIMNITSFQSYYEGNYTLQIRNSHTGSAEVTVTLIRSGPPDTPTDFQLLARKVTSVVLSWNKGSDGGHQQTFVLLYREKIAQVYGIRHIVDTTMNVTIKDEIEHLKSNTNYEFILYSFNEKGNSTDHDTLETRTLKETSTSSLNSGLVGGAAGGVAALLVIIAVLAFVLKRRRNKREDNDSKGILNSKEMSAGPSKRSDDDEDEGGLKDNPLYGSTPGGANAVQGASAAPENLSQYAEVVKPKKKTQAKESKDPPPIYAEVDKSKKKGKGLMKLKKQSPPRVGEDPPPIYAEVNKSNKKNRKGKQQKQKTTTGDVYEVVDGFKEKETQFNDPADMQKNKEGGQRGYRNQDGLLYVDVKFDQPPPTGKPIIRGEERTGYAMIEFEEPPTYSTANDVQGAEGGE